MIRLSLVSTALKPGTDWLDRSSWIRSQFSWRKLLLPMLLAAVVVGSATWLTRPKAKRTTYRTERLDWLTVESVERIRRDPTAIPVVYASCESELTRVLGDSFADLSVEDCRLIFCSLVANAMAPYGPSDTSSLDGLLASTYLNCGSYPVLMARLYEFFGPSDYPPHLIGWDGGFMGPHGMIYRPHPDPERCLFLDPTAALVVRATFDEVASGKPVNSERVVCFESHREMAPFQKWVAGGFVKGKFRPSDVLYYFEGLDHYNQHLGHPNEWPTPGAISLRKREGR
jgi:hypothetical protein